MRRGREWVGGRRGDGSAVCKSVAPVRGGGSLCLLRLLLRFGTAILEPDLGVECERATLTRQKGGQRATTRHDKGERAERARDRRGKYLYAAGGHVELGSELLAEGRVGLCVILVDTLEDLELLAGGALSVLDLVWGVGIEGADVDLVGIHAWRDEAGDAGLVLGLEV